MTHDEIDALKARIGDRLIIASVSGGKDSAAMCLHLQELGLPYRAVFLDTGWEHPATYDYLRGPLAAAIGAVVEIRGKHTMPSLIRSKGMFPSRQFQFCTEELKGNVIRDYVSTLADDGHEVVNAVGIRRGESVNRADASEWEWSDKLDCWVWRPLAAWSLSDVINIHQRHGLAPNPLYLRDFSRVGCFPCKNARKDEIRLAAAEWPQRMEEIAELEREMGNAARARYDRYVEMMQQGRADELTLQARRSVVAEDGTIRPFNPPTYFQPPTGYKGEPWTIDRVVEWSRTARGGKSENRALSLLDAMGINDGCMRWGLCETATEDDSPAQLRGMVDAIGGGK